MLRHFYDLHPGFLGAIIELPLVLKEAASKLQGQTMEVNYRGLKPTAC